MGLFNDYYLYNRHVKTINPILLIDMSTSLLFYTFNIVKQSTIKMFFVFTCLNINLNLIKKICYILTSI